MRRIFAIGLVVVLSVLWGCSATKPQQHSKTYYDVFNTVVTLTAQTQSLSVFEETAEKIHEELLEYHKLFDIYNDYSGVANLKTVNDMAKNEPVRVDGRILELLLYCKEVYTVTDGNVNAAMGSVLQLWHQARSAGLDAPADAALPDRHQLEQAAKHTDFNNVIIDEKACTVRFTDPGIQLDVGAVAKGWAVQKVAQNAPKGWLLNVGGNVAVTGPKADGSDWNVAIQDPEHPDAHAMVLSVSEGCIVTSGDYQRTYQVDGKSYHHIIDPATNYPGTRWRSVSVVCADSAAADMLSTALFLMNKADGQALLEKYKAEAVWIDAKGKQHFSPGFGKLLQK